jgi:hypothetical protein
MIPKAIKVYLSKHYPLLQPTPRKDGWSFWYGAPIGGANSNRIIRAEQSGSNGSTRLKLSVSSRRKNKIVEQQFVGNTAELQSLVDNEIALYLKHYTKNVQK